MFGATAVSPFKGTATITGARRAWGWRHVRNPEAIGPKKIWTKAHENALEPIRLHECRHTFASLMIAAGANAKALSTYMGHSSVSITLDRYGHLMPGNEADAAALLDAYLADVS